MGQRRLRITLPRRIDHHRPVGRADRSVGQEQQRIRRLCPGFDMGEVGIVDLEAHMMANPLQMVPDIIARRGHLPVAAAHHVPDKALQMLRQRRIGPVARAQQAVRQGDRRQRGQRRIGVDQHRLARRGCGRIALAQQPLQQAHHAPPRVGDMGDNTQQPAGRCNAAAISAARPPASTPAPRRCRGRCGSWARADSVRSASCRGSIRRRRRSAPWSAAARAASSPPACR